MRKIFFYTVIALSIPATSFAQPTLENLHISNNSNIPVSFAGDNNVCLGQVGAHAISSIEGEALKKICKGQNCTVKIYPNYSCYGSEEFYFDFNLTYGVGRFWSNYALFIKAEGFQNNIFVVNK